MEIGESGEWLQFEGQEKLSGVVLNSKAVLFCEPVARGVMWVQSLCLFVGFRGVMTGVSGWSWTT